MKTVDVVVGTRVRLTPDARARRLWAAQSEHTATILETHVTLAYDGGSCVPVAVDGERLLRRRMMRLDLLAVVP